MTGLEWLPPHKCGLYLTHNEHRDNYETALDWIENMESMGSIGWVTPEERQCAIDSNEVWHLQWYPETPEGFHQVTASSLEAIRQLFAEPRPQEGDYLQYLVDWADSLGYLEEHCFTFPDGLTIHATKK